MKPLTIVGGGLAGLSLAIALRQKGIDLTLHEAIPYPRHRVCGEFISGVQSETLAKLGIDDLLQDACSLSSSTWRRGDGSELCRFTLPEPARGISRHRLDLRLAERLQDWGGRLELGRKALPSGQEGYVDAAGRRPVPKSPWMGLKCHFRDFPMHADLEMHLAEGAYVGLSAVEEGWVNVCALLPRVSGLSGKGPVRFLQHLDAVGLKELAERLQAATANPASFQGVAGLQLGEQPAAEGFAIGDGNRMICPFTGNGMSMAFESAAQAMGPLSRYAGGQLSWKAAVEEGRQAIRRKHHRRSQLSLHLQSLLFQPPLRESFAFLSRISTFPLRALFHLTR
ncbi:MAG: hypothetical protein AAF555_08150 [Verrucomicrobiota bacterium]